MTGQSPGTCSRKVREEIDELEAEIERGDLAEAAAETGDLLFSIVNLARHLRIEPEQALRATNDRFMRRFAYIEQALLKQGKSIKQATLEEMDLLWEEAKRKNVP